MSNFIMILSILWPNGRAPANIDEKLAAKTNIRAPGNIAEGMSKAQLIKAWGKPLHQSYGEAGSTIYYFNGEPCAFKSKSCSVKIEANKIIAIWDAKPEYLE